MLDNINMVYTHIIHHSNTYLGYHRMVIRLHQLYQSPVPLLSGSVSVPYVLSLLLLFPYSYSSIPSSTPIQLYPLTYSISYSHYTYLTYLYLLSYLFPYSPYLHSFIYSPYSPLHPYSYIVIVHSLLMCIIPRLD